PQAKITFLSQSHGGPALARNLGAKQARSDILLFVDADMRFDKDYVKDL
ncbi:glycosyl transferase, partial [Candidatus Collierbacteria bacterium CG17_big_fil_post_rev_8_21_14_2_50_45_7]